MVVADQIPLADDMAISSEDEAVPRKLAVTPHHPPPRHPPPHHPPPRHPPPLHHPPPKPKAPILPPSSGPFSFVTCPTYASQVCSGSYSLRLLVLRCQIMLTSCYALFSELELGKPAHCSLPDKYSFTTMSRTQV